MTQLGKSLKYLREIHIGQVLQSLCQILIYIVDSEGDRVGIGRFLNP